MPKKSKKTANSSNNAPSAEASAANPTQKEYSKVRNITFTSYEESPPIYAKPMTYLIYGKETCPDTGREHWQGYMQFKYSITWKAVKELMGTTHFEAAKAGPKENFKYCSKDGLWTEFGRPKEQGVRTDLERITDLIEHGNGVDSVIQQYPDMYVKFHNGIDKLDRATRRIRNMNKLRDKYTSFVPRPWQSSLLSCLSNNPKRTVNWFWEPDGGVGKSTFCTWMHTIHGALILRSTDAKDATFQYNDHPYVIFDIPRTEEVNYATIEMFTDELISSNKYESCSKVCLATIAVLANYPPDLNTMSSDRWNIVRIES